MPERATEQVRTIELLIEQRDLIFDIIESLDRVSVFAEAEAPAHAVKEVRRLGMEVSRRAFEAEHHWRQANEQAYADPAGYVPFADAVWHLLVGEEEHPEFGHSMATLIRQMYGIIGDDEWLREQGQYVILTLRTQCTYHNGAIVHVVSLWDRHTAAVSNWNAIREELLYLQIVDADIADIMELAGVERLIDPAHLEDA